MLKKIILVFVILVLILSGLFVYINKVVIPRRVKSLVISGLENATKRQVSIKSINFSFFKGVVLNDLVISENNVPVILSKEASCTFSLFPLLARKLVIPSVNINSPVINLIRRADNTFNLEDILKIQEEGAQKQAFSVSVYKIGLRSGKINFTDNTLNPVFRKSLENVNLNVYLALPANIKFNLKAEVGERVRAKIQAKGEFNLPTQQLSAVISVKDLAPGEFSAYMGNAVSLPSKAVIDGDIKLNYQNDILKADINATVLKLPVNGQIIVSDFKNPVLKANLASNFELGTLQKIALENFAVSLPGNLSGGGNISLTYESALAQGAKAKTGGYLDIRKGTLKLDSLNSPVMDINGRINIIQDAISWSDFRGFFMDVLYKSSGKLTNFKAPLVQLSLSSNNLSLDSEFSINDKKVSFTKLTGSYLNSNFSLNGILDFKEKSTLESDVNGTINFNLIDSKALLKKSAEQLNQIKPAGIINAKFKLTGNALNFKSCSLDGSLSSNSVSAYGLNSAGLSIAYLVSNGLIDIPVIHIDLYDGAVDANVKVNLNSENTPYVVNAVINGVKIEKLKNDTAARDKDIAGTIKGEVKLSGFSDDLTKLTGAGKLFIGEGKLWQLNLLQGLGSILLGNDFSKIVFYEASCGFSVRDKFIQSDNLSMKGNIADMNGSLRLGFDSSIEAQLDVEILAEETPLRGTFKDVTTAILGRSGRFGIITISGTLKDPKFKFQPAVTDIIKGLADTFLRKKQ